MVITVDIDDELLAAAREYTSEIEISKLIEQALRALIDFEERRRTSRQR
jgi:hypothetical protein